MRVKNVCRKAEFPPKGESECQLTGIYASWDRKMSRQIVGAKFFQLHKIFNRYTLKLPYSCMKNMNPVINSHNSHNSQVMKNTTKTKSNQDLRECNCRKSADFPLRGECLVSS